MARPTRDFAMVFKTHFECTRKGDDDQWNDGSCQDGVRNQEGNVNLLNQAGSLK